MGNSAVIVNKADYLDKMNLTNDGIQNFAVNQEKRADNTLKKLVASSSISEETRRSLKPVVTMPGTM